MATAVVGCDCIDCRHGDPEGGRKYFARPIPGSFRYQITRDDGADFGTVLLTEIRDANMAGTFGRGIDIISASSATSSPPGSEPDMDGRFKSLAQNGRQHKSTEPSR